MMTLQPNMTKILDKANAIQSKRQEAIKLSETFQRSVFLEMFGDPVSNPKGWEVRKLSEITQDNQAINTIYLSSHLFLLKNEMMKQSLDNPVLKIGTLKGLKISLPPLALQEKFATIMQNVEIFRTHLEQSEQQREHLLRSLTQKQ
jgi:restriction endonuclease S subunit